MISPSNWRDLNKHGCPLIVPLSLTAHPAILATLPTRAPKEYGRRPRALSLAAEVTLNTHAGNAAPNLELCVFDQASANITVLLARAREGDREAKERLFDALYPELRRLAAHYMRLERAGHTLQPTALINEAYLRCMAEEVPSFHNRAHFLAAAAQVMRRVLVDYARAKRARKREAGFRIDLGDVHVGSAADLEEVLEVDEALVRLGQIDPRQMQIVEMKYFGGLKEEEIAEALGTSTRTVRREWNVARAWLFGELSR